MEISIHTPLRGATRSQRRPYQPMVISIHTPLRGATVSQYARNVPTGYFNPHSLAGSDRRNETFLTK
ncbi:hypothetical protein DXC29_07515 [Bifidobacterium pseudocatenulatum]|nr:hypothetical protein DXC29_07515 [Bifidobacterium pseudocatenulatum]